MSKKKWREKEKRKDELRAKISGRKEHGLQGGQLFYFFIYLFIIFFFALFSCDSCNRLG